VITPILSILATEGLLDEYVGTIPVAFAGFKDVGLTCMVLPTANPVVLVGDTLNDFSLTVFFTT